jgi:hypothetical protein
MRSRGSIEEQEQTRRDGRGWEEEEVKVRLSENILPHCGRKLSFLVDDGSAIILRAHSAPAIREIWRRSKQAVGISTAAHQGMATSRTRI